MHELGQDLTTGRTVHLSTDAFRRHLYLIGKSGVGKTNLLHNLMVADFGRAAGFCLIDPHGDEAERIADSTPEGRFRADAISAIQNKAGAFVSNPAIRNIIGQERSTIHPSIIMDRGLVLICNLAKGRLGEETSSLLGALLTTGFAQAAEGRAKIPEDDRRDFTLYVDEFQNFTTSTFANILSEARKYRLAVCLAHQYASQLPDFLQDAVLGAASTIIAFRVGAKDAPLLAAELGIDNPKRLKDLPNFEALVKTIEEGVPGNARSIRTLPSSPTLGRLPDVRRRTQARYSRPRYLVEQGVNHFLKGY